MVAHVYNPSTQEGEAGISEFKTSLGYIAKPCLKQNAVVSYMN
jgi:hypothetical protein